jgi:hypothetical protein
MSRARPNDPTSVVGLAHGDEPTSGSAARLRHAQRERLNTSLEEMQSDLQHFSLTIQRLQDHFRATSQTDRALNRTLNRTLESTQAIFTALQTAYNHLVTLRTTLRLPSLSQAVSPLQSPPPSTPTHPLSSLFPESRTLSSSTSHSLRTNEATNDWEETISALTTESSPAEERAAHYATLPSLNWSISSGVWAHYNVRRRQATDGEGASSEEEVRRQSEALDDTLWNSIPPPPPSSDRPRPARLPGFNLGWTPRARLPPTQLDSPSTQQGPSSVVQFTRQSQPSAPTITGSSSSSSSFTSSTDLNDLNSGSDGGGHGAGGGAGNDDITSVSRTANRLFQRLSTLQETTRRLREARERRWSNLPDRGLADSQTLATGGFDPFDPTAPARRPDVYANLLPRRVLSTAPPPNTSADVGGEEENKENVERESMLCHVVCGKN